jgi:hypothetical protein
LTDHLRMTIDYNCGMPDSRELSCEEKAEIMRKKCRYRELILSGRLTLPHERASQLLGPDSLYHLYSVSKDRTPPKRR